jgi:serine/threonine-protein kinase
MSPEQATGNTYSLDRRTDIYSLGATTYELLVGRPPFDAQEVLQVIRQIVHKEPRPVRELDKAIPADLEAIVMKCLEKEPHQRYESARALAEDLGRYLDGEPILARQASRFHWAWKKTQKHKLLVAISVSALLVLIVSGVSTLRAKIAAARQAEMAQHVGVIAQTFGQDVKEMEFFMRYAYALPLHDTMREKDLVRLRMAKIERQMENTRASLGNIVEGPGHYALGHGYLVLREPERALNHLERALKSGYTAPEAALAAGQAHGMLYRRSMGTLQHIADKQAREAGKKELEEQHLKPALRYLRQSAGAEVEASPYTTALIALYENRFDDALKAATLAFERSPWLYEAKKTEAEVYFTRGTALHEKGKHEEALSDYRRAVECYQDAAVMARSDPTIHEAEAEAWIQVMVIEGPSGSDLEKPFLHAIASSDNAILAEPRYGRFYAKKAWAYLYYGTHLLSGGADPRPALRNGIDAGQHAIQWDGPDANAYNAIGTSYSFLASYEGRLSLDTRPSLRSAIEHMEKALALNPNSSWAWNDLGTAYTALGEYNASHGSDPLPFFQLGAASFDHAIDLSPNDHVPHVNLGWLYSQKAQYELDHGQRPEESLDHAISSIEFALGMRHDSYQCYNNLGLAHSIKARYERSTGQSADMSFLRARESYRIAIQMHPEDVEARQGAAVLLGQMALAGMERHEEPENALREGRTMIQGIIANNHPNAQAHLALGQLELLAARCAIQKNKSPGKTFKSAKVALEHALALNSGNTVAFQALAELYHRRGEQALLLGLRTGDDIRAGLATIEKALAIDPTMPSSFAIQGALYLLEARTEREPSAQKHAARRAEAALEKALAENPFLKREYEPLALEATRLLGTADRSTTFEN